MGLNIIVRRRLVQDVEAEHGNSVSHEELVRIAEQVTAGLDEPLMARGFGSTDYYSYYNEFRDVLGIDRDLEDV